MREEYHSQIAVLHVAPVVVSADVTPAAGVNMKEIEACKFVVSIGADGATLAGTDKIEFILQESDDDSTYAAVTSADKVIGATPSATGIVITLDGTLAVEESVVEVAYVGDKNFARLFSDVTGTVSIPVGINALTGHLNRSRA